MSKKRPEHRKAFESLAKIRLSHIQAARDVFYMHTLLEAEKSIQRGKWRILELFTVPRNRRAMIGSEVVMFMQQVCSPNTINLGANHPIVLRHQRYRLLLCRHIR
jgi:hypothetical protein